MSNLRRNLIDKKLEITEAENPRIMEKRPTSSIVSLTSFILRNVAPIIAGMKIRKEKRAAFIGFNPKKRRKAIVSPERERPGRIDSP